MIAWQGEGESILCKTDYYKTVTNIEKIDAIHIVNCSPTRTDSEHVNKNNFQKKWVYIIIYCQCKYAHKSPIIDHSLEKVLLPLSRIKVITVV